MKGEIKMERFEFCRQLMETAKNYILLHPNFNVDTKSAINDLVTTVDQGVEALVRDSLANAYPNDSIVGEENGYDFSDSMWIVDPIDGTSNFVTKHKDFTISIAYYANYQPVFGFVYDVMANELFWAKQGGNAYLNGEILHVKDNPKDKAVIDMTLGSVYGFRQLMNVDLVPIVSQVRQVKATHCCTLSMMGIAKGNTQLYLSSKVKVWDYAASNIILKQAGGVAFIPDFFTTEGTYVVFGSSDSMLSFGKDLLNI